MKLVTTTWLSPLLSKKLDGNILRHTSETQWFCLKFKHSEHFSATEIFEKTKFAANHSENVLNWSQQHDFHHCWAKNWMGISWGIPKIQWFCLKQLTTAYFKHSEHFWAIDIFEKMQITVKMCETGHNNMTFTTVEQKNWMGIPWGIPGIQ